MEVTAASLSAPLERSISQQSGTSIRSHRSGARTRKKLTSQPSSSASSIAPSDKSLTSFPSFSPDSPRQERSSFFFFRGDDDSTTATSSRKTSGQSFANSEQGERQEQAQGQERPQPSAIVDHLTTSSPTEAARSALFEDAPLASHKIPGALHHADDEHIERLIARHGAVNLVRQIAEDLAVRDAQIAKLRRRAEERERALRKIVLECGLSSLDLETRLRAIEREARPNGTPSRISGEGISDLMTDAMAEDVRPYASNALDDATLRASSVPLPAPSDAEAETARGSTRGWKEYLWGSGTAKKSSRASSTTREADKQQPTVVKATPVERRPALQDDLFDPPEDNPVRSSSRASSVSSAHNARKPSLASMALRLVAGGASIGRDGEIRGRANSGSQRGGSVRTPSSSSLNASGSARAVSAQGGPKALMSMRRPTGSLRPIDVPLRTQPQERWDAMVSTPGGPLIAQHQSYGPVEMDAILPPEDQPPTLTHIYNNYPGADYLTDRFGFIYDQRRKKRQREAAQMARHAKKGSRTEMISNGRNGISPPLLEDSASGKMSVGSDGRPGTPGSSEELREDAKPKRWQDYLKIATFPTELLSHTPSISAQGFVVLEAAETPKSPSCSPSIMSEDRGFLPSATTTAAITPSDTETLPPSESEQPSATLAKEDAEPVKLLLENLNQLHDTLQREKTVRWNDFLRKVRAERKRDGEAAAAAAAAAAEARFQRATAVMPEARLGDGELIGVASLGIQGKVGRAKANEFRSLVLGGIPVAYRSKIWSECCGAKALRIPGYYVTLVNRSEDQDDPQVVSQIKADITRTLTDNIFFRKGPGVEKLHEVLLAYSRRNPDVGYCQGMNLVVANLLLITPSAEDAFWILVSVVENILPPNYFDHSLLASRADQVVLRQYVAEVLPKLSAHFDALSIDLETMTFQWFLSLFTDCLSAEALFRVWDVVLCSPHDGGAFLFQVALALLKLNENLLLACDSPAEVYTYINHQMTNHAISIDGLVQASEALRRLVRREDIEVRRRKAIEGERELVKAREQQRLSSERSVMKNNNKPAAVVAVGAPAPAVVSPEIATGAPSRSVSRAPSFVSGGERAPEDDGEGGESAASGSVIGDEEGGGA
ncbi:rab-GTPase-TBC domain-containing protein [Chaetomium strumarium]|uniref:Rab-GTPase-TBC domain-containing protein n=1 Tax=Chaetomium strumarium TaxID=1170767 RepID=A0AAJ0GQC7_9PEZI|nr:rab-GTPase-TBC domain-containing protein [Chaetomium strumarium]